MTEKIKHLGNCTISFYEKWTELIQTKIHIYTLPSPKNRATPGWAPQGDVSLKISTSSPWVYFVTVVRVSTVIMPAVPGPDGYHHGMCTMLSLSIPLHNSRVVDVHYAFSLYSITQLQGSRWDTIHYRLSQCSTSKHIRLPSH